MKQYNDFLGEAVSAARLAQLAAKGKGAAASAKMAADGLKGQKAASSALAVTKKKKLPGKKSGALVKVGADVAGALANRPKKNKKPGAGYMSSPDTETKKKNRFELDKEALKKRANQAKNLLKTTQGQADLTGTSSGPNSVSFVRN